MNRHQSSLRVGSLARWGAMLCVTALVCGSPTLAQEAEDRFAAQSNAAVEVVQALTDLELGAAQGVVVRDGKIYAYGDLVRAVPRIGVIREYDLNLKATGRAIRLSRNGTPLIVHPTGLTWNDRWGTFLGDTVNHKATIYRLDWDKAWEDGHLDRAVLATLEDDAAINGCRPLLVRLDERELLATADYGDIHPEIRLYDPEALLAHGRSSAPGVVVHRVLCGPFNQNLYWDAGTGSLTCVQNVIEGKGWRLDRLDLKKAVADGRAHSSGARLQVLTFPYVDELEGYWPLEGPRALFVAARRQDNLVVGTIRAAGPLETK